LHPLALANNPGPCRIRRTFAFVDLCGFTDFLDTEGPDEAMRELYLLRAAVRDVAPRCGVRVDKWLGDGAMLVGVDPEPVVTAVMAITERLLRTGRLSPRAGIASGEVFLLEGDDYVGGTVNLASRLCDGAAEGEVLAATDDLVLPEGVRTDATRQLRVRGMAVPVAVCSLVIDEVEATVLRVFEDGKLVKVRRRTSDSGRAGRDAGVLVKTS
jgi:class 3 adenylate cyclase